MATGDADKPGNRSISRVIQGVATSDGAGVSLTRVIGAGELEMLDPFLLLDSFESDNPDDYIAGFPSHPHRGFETVTYILAGKMRHKDSTGREGVIEPGGIQWMTAARGIIHSEMPEQTDGLLQGFQLWVNLPSDLKMAPAQYREFPADAVPVEQRDDGSIIRVVAGLTDEGTQGPVTEVATDPLYLDVELAEGAQFSQAIPNTHNAFVYVIAGEISVVDETASSSAGERSLAVLDCGDRVTIVGESNSARLLLVAGKRLNEPVARYGPFVMNTREEIIQAANDYQNGNFLTDS
jgi:quercetin 2,3-dioxygenase